MDKGFTGNDSSSSISSSSASASASATQTNSSCTSSNRDLYLKQLNKNSHKITKPVRRTLPPPPPPQAPTPDPNPAQAQAQAQSQQPPVYNINKNDFREVVQKLTGSPAHERLPAAPPVPVHPRPPSSRLQRIRPPPLVQIANRPPQNQIGSFPALPPLPAVHTAAESPISAYMRLFQNQNDVGAVPPSSPISAYMRFLQNSYNSSVSAPLPQNSGVQVPLSPLPFGCVPSPRSPYGMPSPNLLFSSTGGQLGFPQLPLSPTPPVQSPRWKGY